MLQQILLTASLVWQVFLLNNEVTLIEVHPVHHESTALSAALCMITSTVFVLLQKFSLCICRLYCWRCALLRLFAGPFLFDAFVLQIFLCILLICFQLLLVLNEAHAVVHFYFVVTARFCTPAKAYCLQTYAILIPTSLWKRSCTVRHFTCARRQTNTQSSTLCANSKCAKKFLLFLNLRVKDEMCFS